MKKYLLILIILPVLTGCGSSPVEVERIVEDGIEVVLNPLEPVPMDSNPFSITIREEFRLDTGDDTMAERGLTDILAFDIDEEGGIYILNLGREEQRVLKFGPDGNFLTSFGRKGQGPGELQMPSWIAVNSDGEIGASDYGNKKLALYDTQGQLLREIPFGLGDSYKIPLTSDRFLIFASNYDRMADFAWTMPLTLENAGGEELCVLDRHQVPNYFIGRRIKATHDVYVWSAGQGRIFVGEDSRGYDIWVFDYDGNPIRKIRKESNPIPLSDETKAELQKKIDESGEDAYMKFAYVPDSYPPFHHLSSDEKGRLFVLTYEEGEEPGTHMCDIFDSDGVFRGRIALDVYFGATYHAPARARGDRLYCLQEKEDGFKVLTVYSMR